MGIKEEWILVGAGPERINMADGTTAVKSPSSEPFTPAKDSLFHKLKKQGRLKSIRTRIEEEPVDVEQSEPEVEEENSPLGDEPSEPPMVTDMDGEAFLDEMGMDLDDEQQPKDVGIDELDIPARVKTVLNQNGIFDVSEILMFSHHELDSMDGIGEQSLEDIEDALEELGLKLEE